MPRPGKEGLVGGMEKAGKELCIIGNSCEGNPRTMSRLSQENGRA